MKNRNACPGGNICRAADRVSFGNSRLPLSWGRDLQKHPAVSDTQRAQGHTGRLASRLQLTKEQEAQLNAILEDSKRQIDAGRKELESKMQTIRAKTNERIAAILNDEQRTKFQQLSKRSKIARAACQSRPRPWRSLRAGPSGKNISPDRFLKNGKYIAV